MQNWQKAVMKCWVRQKAGALVLRVLMLVAACVLMTGCAAVVPFSSLLSGLQSGPPPQQIHDETRVDLFRDDFVLVRTNVIGQCKGFSLLGLITIVPATVTKATSRMYASAQMQPGEPQTPAHLIIEQTSSYYILFGIPKVTVSADIVAFRPLVHGRERNGHKPPPRGPPEERPEG